MDVWTRLFSSPKPADAKEVSHVPQQRLVRFQRIYDQILQVFSKSSLQLAENATAETIRQYLHRLTGTIRDESLSQIPHPCLEYALSCSMHRTVANIAMVIQKESVFRAAVALFSALVEGEEDFISSRDFADSVMGLVDAIKREETVLPSDEPDLGVAELLFAIVTKTRQQPELLSTWFKIPDANAASGTNVPTPPNFVGNTLKDDFPLCYHLVDYVHCDGKTGDFARTGLLYIFDTASHSYQLEEWLVESDLPTLMASGLGALYSQLSRRISTEHPEKDLPTVLALSDHSEKLSNPDVESYFSISLQAHLDTFISSLAFWKDVLERCSSTIIQQTLIEHFEILFLQQLLYPSILESSDTDGGSSVAVLTYLTRILESLHFPLLNGLIFHYLLGTDKGNAKDRLERSTLLKRRSSSLHNLLESTKAENAVDPSVFNLADLILSSVKSKNDNTVKAAFKLIAVILHRYHAYAKGTLINMHYLPSPKLSYPTEIANIAMNQYVLLAESIGTDAHFDEDYRDLLDDAWYLVEVNPCAQKLLSAGDHGANAASLTVSAHRLRSREPILKAIFNFLHTFLTNSIELNLAVTEAVAALISCPSLCIEGLMLTELSNSDTTASNILAGEATKADSIAENENGSGSGNGNDNGSGNDHRHENAEGLSLSKAKEQEALEVPQSHSRIYSVLSDIKSQLDQINDRLPALTSLVASRRATFRTQDILAAAAAKSPKRQPLSPDMTPRSATPSEVLFDARDSLSRLNISEALGLTPSRSQSPHRGLARTKSRPSVDASQKSASNLNPASAKGSLSSSQPSPTRSSTHVKQQVDEVGSIDIEAAFVEMEENATTNHTALLTRQALFHLDGQITILDVMSDDDSRDPDAASAPEGTELENMDPVESGKRVSLNHVVTNAVLLQHFILELVAIMQVRASLRCLY